ncbi:MAG: hypothetical protein QOI36_6368 [Pseudonocardiales bacterium]|nr:hypothetical protein [Pseudonocardiales bacterium]
MRVAGRGEARAGFRDLGRETGQCERDLCGGVECRAVTASATAPTVEPASAVNVVIMVPISGHERAGADRRPDLDLPVVLDYRLVGGVRLTPDHDDLAAFLDLALVEHGER